MTRIFCVPCQQMQDDAGNRACKDKSLQGVEVPSIETSESGPFHYLKIDLIF
jgi:hypothetical protein